MWSAFDAHRIQTTNACETYHSKLKSMLYRSHSHIFILVDALLEVQEMTYLKMRNPPQAENHSQAAVIEEYMAKLEDGKITRLEYVHDLARKCMPPKVLW